MAKTITPEEVAKRLQSGEKVHIIDVREKTELAAGQIRDAKNIPLSQIALRKNELDKEENYIVVCQSGNRSKAASGILGALGFKAEDMIGGMNDWNGELE